MDNSIDAQIAKFMGWYQVPHRIINNIDFGEGPWHKRKGDPCDPHKGVSLAGPPSYSHNHAAAWNVIEMIQRGPVKHGDIGVSVMAFIGGGHRCCFLNYRPVGTFIEVYADAETVPLAICQAALKVMDAGLLV